MTERTIISSTVPEAYLANGYDDSHLTDPIVPSSLQEWSPSQSVHVEAKVPSGAGTAEVLPNVNLLT